MNKKQPFKMKSSTIKWVVLTLGILIASTGVLYGIDNYQSPTLYGKWVSKDTGEWIKFNKDGTVLLKDTAYTPSFTLLAPGKMSYTIEDKTFTMHYALNGRSLEWSMEKGEKETFERR